MRLFIATTFPDAVMRELNARICRVKSRLPPASWVRPDTQHLTFAFLGEQPDALVTQLEPLIEKRLSQLKSFEAKLRGCGFFPNSRNARVAWVGVTPEDQLAIVSNAVREGVAAAGVKLDGSEFKPHLTLCRIRDHWPPACMEIYKTTFGTLESEPFTIDTVTLYSSRLSPSGATHTPLRQFTLGRSGAQS